MLVELTDSAIAALLTDQKLLAADWQERPEIRIKREDRQRSITLNGASGGEFIVIARQRPTDQQNFSLVLAVSRPRNPSRFFHLRRYDGNSHVHHNRLEGNRFAGFHIHQATERYQRLANSREDGFAVATDRYSDLTGAWRCLIEDANVGVNLELPFHLL